MSSDKPGVLVVLEGPDGVGKTSLSQQLVSQLNEYGLQAEYLAFPGNKKGSLGELVYRIHHNSASLEVESVEASSLQILHVAAHADALAKWILPSLENGVTLVMDRYWWSTWVYGVVGGVRKSVLDCLISLEKACWMGITPDLVFFIDRDSPWREEEIGSFWLKLATLYRNIAEREGKEYTVVNVKNRGSLEDETERLLRLVLEKVS